MPSRNLKSHYFSVKLLMIAVVGIIFLIASFWLNHTTISDRQSLLRKAKEDIVLSWAGAQTLLGPLLIVPYTDHSKKDTPDGHLVFFPNKLHIKGEASPEIRHRGIFNVLVYQSEVDLDCQFTAINQHKDANKTVHWSQAKIIICLDDVRGLNNIALKINGQNANMLAGSAEFNSEYPGVHALHAVNNKTLSLTAHISMKGSDTLNIAPIAKENQIQLAANWPNPSFIGNFLPNTKNITQKDFQAQWQVSSFATGLPEYFDLKDLGAGQKNALFNEWHKSKNFSKRLGVRFLETADHYQQSERSTKYSFLFVLYTFLVFFLFEVIKKTKIHIFQYCITACSFLCFSLLLTAFAEHISFTIAYITASVLVIGQIAFYVFGLIQKAFERAIFVGFLVILYTYLFIVMRLEELALLVGALGMFAVITVAMILTRKINWFEEK